MEAELSSTFLRISAYFPWMSSCWTNLRKGIDQLHNLRSSRTGAMMHSRDEYVLHFVVTTGPYPMLLESLQGVGALGKTVFFHLKLLSYPIWNSLNSLLLIFVMAQAVQSAESRAVHCKLCWYSGVYHEVSRNGRGIKGREGRRTLVEGQADPCNHQHSWSLIPDTEDRGCLGQVNSSSGVEVCICGELRKFFLT